MRLAAKLLGWRIDIKSEEEKRQEVEVQMAALVVPGAPVSILIDHGLADTVVEKLMQGGIPTVERLGSMTPEQLEEIEGIDPETVESIQLAVNSYYGQFEGSFEGPASIETQAGPPEETPDHEQVDAPEAEQVDAPAINSPEPENESVTIVNTEHLESE